ncbi:MAG: MFS transporter [Synergistales bacterium]
MSKRSRVPFFMVVSMFLGYMPWYGFSAVLPHLVREFELTPRQTGSILGAFQLGDVLTVIAGGILADRFGNKRVLGGVILATGIFSTLFAFLSDGYASILVLRLLTGLSAGAISAPGMAPLSAVISWRWSIMAISLPVFAAALLLAPAALFFFPERRRLARQIACDRQAL